MKRKLRKLQKKVISGKPYKSHTIKLNNMVHVTAHKWRCDGKVVYEVSAHIDTAPFSNKAGWCCFYSTSVESFKGLRKKIKKALHKHLEVDYGF